MSHQVKSEKSVLCLFVRMCGVPLYPWLGWKGLVMGEMLYVPVITLYENHYHCIVSFYLCSLCEHVSSGSYTSIVVAISRTKFLMCKSRQQKVKH